MLRSVDRSYSSIFGCCSRKLSIVGARAVAVMRCSLDEGHELLGLVGPHEHDQAAAEVVDGHRVARRRGTAGRRSRFRSSGIGWYSTTDSITAVVRLRWVSMAPFGKPVVPLV